MTKESASPQTPSSRPNVLRGLIIAALIVAIGFGFHRWLGKDAQSGGGGEGSSSAAISPSAFALSQAAQSPPVLVLSRSLADGGGGGGGGGGGASDGGGEERLAAREIFRAAALDAVLLSVDDPGRHALSAAVVETNTRLEARANPLTEDLEGGDPEVAMREWSRGRASMLRAATEFARASWCAADGLCVSVLEKCPAPLPKDGRCVPAWGPTSDPDAARARFMAWPFGSAAILRVEDRATVAALRIASRIEGSSIALVISGRDHADLLARSWGPDLRKKVELWQLLSAIVRNEERHTFSNEGTSDGGALALRAVVDGGGNATKRSDGDSALHLGDQDLVVVPKLASITKPDDLVSEIGRIAPRARIVAFPSKN